MASNREKARQRLLRHAVFLICLGASTWMLLRVRANPPVLSPNARSVITESGLREILNSRAATTPNPADTLSKSQATASEVPDAQIMVKVDRRTFIEKLSFDALRRTTDGVLISPDFIELFSISNPADLLHDLQILAESLLQEQRRRKVIEPIDDGLNKIYIPDVETELRVALPAIAAKFTSRTNASIFVELVFRDFYWRKFVTRHTFKPRSDANGEIFIEYAGDRPSVQESTAIKWSQKDFAELSSMGSFVKKYPYNITLRELVP